MTQIENFEDDANDDEQEFNVDKLEGEEIPMRNPKETFTHLSRSLKKAEYLQR